MSACSSIVAGRDSLQRLRLEVTGAVQGVGFRPFVHRLAVSEGLGGFVRNTTAGAEVEIEGQLSALERFLARLTTELTAPATIRKREITRCPTRGDRDFMIVRSECTGLATAVVMPDLATCSDCISEMRDPCNRRYRYPFTTCMHCGPRYSIIEALPYDRERTTMRNFAMCPSCRAEYDSPRSRRFHAETNACPECGPYLLLWDSAGKVLGTADEALTVAATALQEGQIVALKGLGGFQLLADARNTTVVNRLRRLKQRPAKPFALMVATLSAVRDLAYVPIQAAELMQSPAAPIILLRARTDRSAIARSVAPGNAYLGIMLPTTPLHYLLMESLGFPIIATSGNRGDEPIVVDEHQALLQLAGLADLYLVHNRPIRRPVDDSVVRIMGGQETVLRNARGYAPTLLEFPSDAAPVLAVGGHQKNAIAMFYDQHIVLGPHVGNLDCDATRAAFAGAIEGTMSLYGVHPTSVACDLHPDYHSTRLAERRGLPIRRTPHHLAHALAGIVDNQLQGPVLSVTWDGSGYGLDNTLWGGEFLIVGAGTPQRVAHLLPFQLPGGEVAMREPRRAGLGVLYAIYGDAVLQDTDLAPVAAFAPAMRPVLTRMLARGVCAPATSSAGRLFDAVASILDLKQMISFEGEAAMAVESAAEAADSTLPVTLPDITVCQDNGILIADWRVTILAIVDAVRGGTSATSVASAFHRVLAALIADIATRTDCRQVLLTGGCFQNARLLHVAISYLHSSGVEVYWHHRVPPNDGGLAVGQAAYAAGMAIGDIH